MSLKPPEIWAPVRPSIPSGFSLKLMIGRVLTSLSRTTAKWPDRFPGFFCADRADRLGLTALGDLPGYFLEGALAGTGEVEGDDRFVGGRGVDCSGSVMSCPLSAGLSFSANQPGVGVFDHLARFVDRSSETRTVPGGTSTTIPFLRPFLPGRLK